MEMKTNKLFATLILVLICTGMYTAKAQTVLVDDSFRKGDPDTTKAVTLAAGGSICAFPTGWTTNNKYNSWTYNSQKFGGITNGTGYVTFAFAADANQSDVPHIAVDSVETITSPDLGATTGYATIYVSWVERVSSKYLGVNMDSTTTWWSTNNTTWEKIAHNPNTSGSDGITNGDTPIALPSAAAGAAHLYLQWRADVNGTINGNYQFTDIVVSGSKSTGLNDVLYALNPKVTAFSSNNLLHLQFANTNGVEAQVYVYDINGKSMFSENVVTSADQLINISNLASGMYTARVIVAGQATTTKFVK